MLMLNFKVYFSLIEKYTNIETELKIGSNIN